MQVSLAGKTALITGGSQGLGRAMARQFALSGAKVAIMARRREQLDATVAELSAETKASITGYSCDVSDRRQVDQTWAQLESEHGGIDILVNNAGGSSAKPIGDITYEMFMEDVELKVFAALKLSQLVIPGMKQRRWGRILNTVSIFGKTPKRGPTAISRSAGISMTKIMANELAPHNILVNAMCTGLVLSDQWPKLHARDAPDTPYEEYLQKMARDIPLGRFGKVEEFANVACFLASDAASFITGTAINVDGGQCAVT